MAKAKATKRVAAKKQSVSYGAEDFVKHLGAGIVKGMKKTIAETNERLEAIETTLLDFGTRIEQIVERLELDEKGKA